MEIRIINGLVILPEGKELAPNKVLDTRVGRIILEADDQGQTLRWLGSAKEGDWTSIKVTEANTGIYFVTRQGFIKLPDLFARFSPLLFLLALVTLMAAAVIYLFWTETL